MQGGAERRGTKSREAGRKVASGSLRALRGVLGDARVYLKVSVLVEAGEAVRHFAAFTPPQDDALRFAPSLPRRPPPPCFHASSHAHRAHAAGREGGGAGREGGREEERVLTGIPKAQALCGPGGGTFAHRPASRTARSDPRGPRMHTCAGAPRALPEGKINGAGRGGFGGVCRLTYRCLIVFLSALVSGQAHPVFGK